MGGSLMLRLTRRGLIAAAALPLPALAQSPYPNRAIRLVVPFAAGGGTDIVARIYAQKMTELLGQPMVVENRAGAGGNLGLENIARSAPDGYSLVLSSNGPVAVNRFLFRDMPIDPSRDLVPVSMTFRIEQALVVHPSLPVNSVQDFIALARTRELNWGSGGTGSSLHLAGELFKLRAGVPLVHIPYRGGAPAMNDLVAGNIHSMFDSLPSLVPQLRGGRVKGLAICATKRHPLVPELPTMVEAGVPNYEAGTWGAVFAPTGTPQPVIARLAAATREALSHQPTRDALARAGGDAEYSTPDELAGILRREIATWGAVVREANIQPS
jgi:tripartite-type tricarboxylate transporter receptor subunit TctC